MTEVERRCKISFIYSFIWKP